MPACLTTFPQLWTSLCTNLANWWMGRPYMAEARVFPRGSLPQIDRHSRALGRMA